MFFEPRTFQVGPDQPVNVTLPYHCDTGDRLEFHVSVSGPPVSYAIIRPDNAVVLTSDAEGDYNAGSIIVQIPGEYRIQFSTPDTASVVLSGEIYPAP